MTTKYKPNPSYPDLTEVYSHRRFRGYVKPAQYVKKVVTGDRRLEMEIAYVTVDGWRAVGFAGRTGRVKDTFQEAVNDLVSNHWLSNYSTSVYKDSRKPRDDRPISQVVRSAPTLGGKLKAVVARYFR